MGSRYPRSLGGDAIFWRIGSSRNSFLSSEDNARSFQTDLWIDAKGLNEALTKHHIATHRRVLAESAAHAQTLSGTERAVIDQWIATQTTAGPDTRGTDVEENAFRQLLSEMGVKEGRRPVMTSGEHGFAARIGQAEEFSPMFTVCSKLMHRTALSISAENAAGALDAIVPILKDCDKWAAGHRRFNHDSVCRVSDGDLSAPLSGNQTNPTSLPVFESVG